MTPLKRKKTKEVVVCPVCEDSIDDPSDQSDGDDSVFREGYCNVWFHRRCAGLSIQAFKKLTQSKEPFTCYQCSLVKHKEETANLKLMIQNLSKEVSEIKNKVFESKDSHNKSQANTSTTQQRSANKQPPTPKTLNTIPQAYSTERSFNIVVYGINESPTGTSKPNRVKDDLEKLLPSISKVDATITSKSIKDLHRLGRYREDQDRPRPILVKFLSALDANNILLNRGNISPPIVIKPDMSKEERDIESVLLRERWNLIQSGIDRKLIKISNKHIYVNNQLYGSIHDSRFTKITTSSESTNNNSGANNSDTADTEMEDLVPPGE